MHFAQSAGQGRAGRTERFELGAFPAIGGGEAERAKRRVDLGAFPAIGRISAPYLRPIATRSAERAQNHDPEDQTRGSELLVRQPPQSQRKNLPEITAKKTA